MKTPLCTICLKNFPLICGNCQEKIDSGEVAELDVKVARALVSLENKFPSLKEATFQRALQTNGLIIILVGRGDIRRILGRNKRVLRELQDQLDGEVRIIEESRNPQHVLRDLLRPVRIMGVNTIWLPDNSFERKVRISTRDRDRIPLSLEQLETIVHQLTGERIRIAFD